MDQCVYIPTARLLVKKRSPCTAWHIDLNKSEYIYLVMTPLLYVSFMSIPQ